MSTTENTTTTANVADEVEEDEGDFVNISFLEEEEEKVEHERTEIMNTISGASGGDVVDVNLNEHSGDVNNTLSASADTTDNDDDRKPAAAAVGASPARSQSKDARFMCAICIDTVSDEPVVTRCGHIFCWPCLYQWLAPGMLLNEYFAAFGGSGGGMMERTISNNNHGGSRGNLNNFISEMATHDSSNSHAANDRPYDVARFNSARRVCPVCKAFCSVDSVIPIYIHVHANAAGSQANRQGNGPITQEQSSQNEEQNLDNNGGDDNNHLDESPLSPSDELFDPTAANIGLRQRRRPLTAQTSNASNNTAPESPQTTQNMYENIPSNDATITPVIRNGGGDNIAVPNRPFLSPISSVTTNNNNNNNNNSNVPNAAASQQQHHQYDNPTAAPMLSSSTITSSSSFRLAYRPRHVDRQMGGLMGIVSGLVQSIDNIGTAANPTSESTATRDRHRSGEVPQIHRSDNGLGGIGRASERNSDRSSSSGEQFDGRMGAAGGAGGVMNGEDSSLAMAREFLSRLVSRMHTCVCVRVRQ